MSTAAEKSNFAGVNPFRPERYPALRTIVAWDTAGAQSLADMVSETILKEIVGGKLPPSTRIKSTQLAERLGVSRTPVAKALAKLTADGILVQPNNHQAIVTEQAAMWLVEIHELRELLEPEAAYRAAGAIPEQVVGDLWALARDARPTEEYDWSAAAKYFDFALHLSVAEYCGNLPVGIAIRKCWSYKRLSYELSEGCRSELVPEYEQHVQLLQALATGDKQQARQLMRDHLRDASHGRYSTQVV